jgi:hypothetical protein
MRRRRQAARRCLPTPAFSLARRPSAVRQAASSTPANQDQSAVRRGGMQTCTSSHVSPNRTRYFLSRPASFGWCLAWRDTANRLRPALDNERDSRHTCTTACSCNASRRSSCAAACASSSVSRSAGAGITALQVSRLPQSDQAACLRVAQRELACIGSAMNQGHNQGPGNALMVTLDDELVTEVFSAFGDKSVTAENVARQRIHGRRGLAARAHQCRSDRAVPGGAFPLPKARRCRRRHGRAALNRTRIKQKAQPVEAGLFA